MIHREEGQLQAELAILLQHPTYIEIQAVVRQLADDEGDVSHARWLVTTSGTMAQHLALDDDARSRIERKAEAMVRAAGLADIAMILMKSDGYLTFIRRTSGLKEAWDVSVMLELAANDRRLSPVRRASRRRR